MGDVINERSVVENPNFGHPVEVVRDWPDLDALGAAGARMKLDLLLLKPEGMTPEEHEALRGDEVEVLRAMAMREDPAFGVTHQTAAIGALAEREDTGALLALAERARDRRTDDRVRIAAIHALGQIGGPGVGTVVGELLEEKQPAIRAQAVQALAKVGGVEHVGRLEEIAATTDDPAAPLADRIATTLRVRAGLE